MHKTPVRLMPAVAAVWSARSGKSCNPVTGRPLEVRNRVALQSIASPPCTVTRQCTAAAREVWEKPLSHTLPVAGAQ